jgi:hypothetical protein
MASGIYQTWYESTKRTAENNLIVHSLRWQPSRTISHLETDSSGTDSLLSVEIVTRFGIIQHFTPFERILAPSLRPQSNSDEQK